MPTTFTPAADVYAALREGLEALAGRGYFATHATALAEDPDNFVCRCCTVVPPEQQDRYVIATGGDETTCTAALLAERGDEAISWRGDAAEIVDVLRSHGLDASWDGNSDRCVMVTVSEEQRRLVADRYTDEINRYAEQDDDEAAERRRASSSCPGHRGAALFCGAAPLRVPRKAPPQGCEKLTRPIEWRGRATQEAGR